MNLCALRHERIGGQQHHVLPTVQAADAAIGALINGKSKSIPLPPNGALAIGGFEFTVATQNFSVAADKQESALHGPVRPGIKFDNPNGHIDVDALCSCAETVGRRARNLHRAG